MSDPSIDTVNTAAFEHMLSEDLWDLTPATLLYRITKKKWIPAKHLLYISSKYAQAVERGDARLILSMPTRHGKSEVMSFGTPLWILHHHPDWEIILLSYGADLAEKFSMRVRDAIIEDSQGENILNCKVKKGAERLDGWMTTEGGGMRATGMMGSVYGHGAHVLLVDDYYKNPKEAFSAGHRKDVYDNFAIVADSRLAPGGSVLINATRWPVGPDGDLAGQLLSAEDSAYTEIKLPAFAMKGDVLGREEGAPLWPERYNEKSLLTRKSTMGPFFWAALGQQTPLRTSSGLFDEAWIEIVNSIEVPYQHLRAIRVWDFAATQDDGDWTTGILAAEDVRNGDFWILDVQRVQKSPRNVELAVIDAGSVDGIYIPIYIEQEPGASGKSIIGHYQRNILPGFSVTAISPSGNKFVRAQPFFGACEARRVKFKKGSWNRPLLDECLQFNAEGEHDDQVDGAAHAFNKLFGATPSAGTWGRSSGSGQTGRVNGTHIARTRTGEEVGQNIVTGVTWGRRR